jgi:hypothetical protein
MVNFTLLNTAGRDFVTVERMEIGDWESLGPPRFLKWCSYGGCSLNKEYIIY